MPATVSIDLATATQRDYINYSRNVVHAHSRAVQHFFDLLTSYIPGIEEQTKASRISVWVQGGWPCFLLYAAGYLPAVTGELGRYATRDTLEIAETYFQVPGETCSMVRSIMGSLYNHKDGPIKRILASAGGCEPLNMAYESLRDEGFDVFYTDAIYRAKGLTGQRLEDLIQYHVDEIKKTNKWLTGTEEIDKEGLRSQLERRNAILSKYRKILELRRTRPFYIKSLPFRLLSMGFDHCFGEPEEFVEVLDELIYELEEAPVNEIDIKRAIPLIWAGGGLQEFGVFEVIDESDGFLISSSMSDYERDYDLSFDPVEAIARYNLGGTLGGASIYRVKGAERELAKFNARGLIIYGYVGCSFRSVENEIIRNYFHDKNVPMLILEGTYQVGPPPGQTITRIKAFMDMLE
jgi:benzoyl-CoA reductase/2-hydroxyglutaryl-CoA dehydratase subunit BcrC/BadD/HgdB